MRQVILDTETTGLNPATGDRIIEIGCVEMIGRRLTDRTFHYYINPERDIDAGAFAVHGLSREFLSDKPIFAHIVEELIEFIDGAEVVIHNAAFDLGFLDNEFALLKRAPFRGLTAKVTDKTINLTATSSSGNPVTYTSTPINICTVSGSVLNLLLAGNCSVTATQAGTSTLATVSATATLMLTGSVISDKKSITCVKGKSTKKVSGTNPKCPKGYKLKK